MKQNTSIWRWLCTGQVRTLILSAGAVLMLIGCAGNQERFQQVQFDPNSYVVQVGDTIESVAFRYQLTSQQLLGLNPNTGGVIYPGDKILVRSGRRTLQSAPSQRREVPASYRPGDQRSYRSNQTTRNIDNPQNRVVVQQVPLPSPAGRVEPVAPARTPVVSEEIISESTPIESVRPPATATTQVDENGWLWPSGGEVVRDYAPGELNGQGIDIAGVPGQQIQAAAAGTVIYAGRDLSNSGNLVIVRHSDNLLSTYSHASQLYVAEDDHVEPGDPLASLGSNSKQESVLHFGIRENGKPVDPRKFLPAR